MFYYCSKKTKSTILTLLIFICSTTSLISQNTRLIVRADDLGASRSINLAIIKSYKEGIVRSAEVIVPGPWFEEAVKLANEYPNLDIGVHITLTSEWSNIKWRPLTKVESITDENGYFFPFVWPNESYPKGSIMESDWKIDEIEREVRAQIETAIKRIPHVSHISTHMGCLSFSDETNELLYKLAKEYNLNIISNQTTNVINFPRWSGSQLSKEQKLKNLINNIKSLNTGAYLLIEHPAFDDTESQGMGHIGYENVAEDREGVTYSFTHDAVKSVIKEKNIELISYKDFFSSQK